MKPIRKNSDKLDSRQKTYLKKKFGVKAYKDLHIVILTKLKETMKKLTDTRVQYKCQYKIWDIVVCVVISVMCGKKDWEEIHDFVELKYNFFRQFLKMTGGIPSAKTYERIMGVIDYKELENILGQFFKTVTQEIISDIEMLHIDGRVNNGSKRKGTIKSSEVKPLNMLNVYSDRDKICIASEMIDEKSNEIPAVKNIINKLSIKGAIITWDALNTQKANIAAVVKSECDYVVPIKSNHSLFYQELIDFFNEKEQEYIIAGKLNTAYKKICEYKNGSAIVYEYFQTTEINWFEDKKEWENLESFIMVKKTIERDNNTTIEQRYYISSLNINIDLMIKAIRNHWHVENQLHWHLDFTFKLDKNNTLDKNALANLEIVSKFCLGVLKRVQKYYDRSIKRIIGLLEVDVEVQFIDLIAFLVLSNGFDE